ncbi:phospholipase D/nuclease [Karstenula rhodostoma CBS 690.94]|uniref:Phospholipase D/nuclease n=1 Tax=Karstenula rhodostoma CBS 690.94 TaxID=1392251 RepID=A0A9P4P7E9_9PLEO|nr:phospholipase D/nuclease [Karstenula rhodostoma CBS 690.94]
MTSAEGEHEGPPNKRRKLDADVNGAGCTPSSTSEEAIADEATATSLQRPISPPPLRSRQRTPHTSHLHDAHVTEPSPADEAVSTSCRATVEEEPDHKKSKVVRSPVQLSRIRDLAPHQNEDSVGLRDILGDPMIKECWNFNYLFDVDFVMSHFDTDVRDIVQVKIIHGFWKNVDERRIAMLEAAERYPNVQTISAYLPDPFGTHHTKMLILFQHDDFAQIVIHTANMIERDWTNMTQAVWKSPLLPLQMSPTPSPTDVTLPIGTGGRFMKDLLFYLNAYGRRLHGLTEQLVNYDPSAIRAAFLGSAPSRQKPAAARPSIQTSFGWLGLKQILSTTPVQPTSSTPNIVAQVSSIATLGATPTWLNHFHSVLNRTASSNRTFFAPAPKNPSPSLNIIFPTAPEIRTSLDGYASGASIHTKTQSPVQQKQLEYLRPLLCHWKHQDSHLSAVTPEQRREAHRGPAAPHIKTYVRFADEGRTGIDWAMVTSANLSKQAWGEVENKKGEVWVQSYEAGVVVWPGLFSDEDGDEGAVMVPVFGQDRPLVGDVGEEKGKGKGKGKGKTVVGFRMPYDLPLSPYGEDEVPWCATMPDNEEDWMGRVWNGY